MKGKGMNSMKFRAASLVVAGAIATFGCFSSAAAIGGSTLIHPTYLQNSLLDVRGPVEKIDLVHGVLIIAGQSVTVGTKTSFSNDGVPSEENVPSLQQIQVGDLVAVFGRIGAPAISIVRLSSAYVAGATTIFVKGQVTSVDATVGSARINGLTIDYTAAMSDPTFVGIGVGNIINVSGIQPIAGGQLLANMISHVSITPTASRTSIIGTGDQATSIIGTGAAQTRSIIGTGSQSMSIIGTGALAN